MDRDRPRGLPPARVQQRAVVSHVAPPPRPVRFDDKREALASHPGRPLDRDAEEQIRAKVERQPANPPARGGVQTAGPQHENEGVRGGQQELHENEGVRRGQEGRNVGAPQPSSDIRVNGRVTAPVPGSVQQNTGPGRENNNDRPGPAANGHYVPRPPQRGQQAEQPRQGQQGNGAPREMETRGGQNQSNREIEPAVARPGQGRVIEQPQTESRSMPQPSQDRGNGNGRGQNSARAADHPSQDRPADDTPRGQQRNVPRPPERNMNESAAPAQAVPSQPRDNSAGDQGRANGNYSAQPRSNRQADQPSNNAAPAQTRQSQPDAAPTPSVRQTSYDNRPAPNQSESRPAAPQRQEAPAAHANSNSGHAAVPVQESKTASSHSEDKGKSKDDKH
jgi:hypothetical protein